MSVIIILYIIIYLLYIYIYIIKYQIQIEVLRNTPVNSTHLASEATFGIKYIFGTIKNKQNPVMNDTGIIDYNNPIKL